MFISSIVGDISGIKICLKYVGLIEILFSCSIFSISGYSVLSNIVVVVMVRSMLLVSRNDLCVNSENVVFFDVLLDKCFVCYVNRFSVLFVMIFSNVRMKRLCFGLIVNVCIDVSMFECMRNVLSRLSENVKMVSSVVYVWNMLCFFVIVNEWISVVLVSYGMNDVFLIGF